MTATMTWVGLDVHARSTHAAAIDRESGELTRARFGAGARRWWRGLRGCRSRCVAATRRGRPGTRSTGRREAAGLRVDVIAPTKTPRAAARSGQDRPQGRRAARAAAAGRSLTVVARASGEYRGRPAISRARASRCGPICCVAAIASRSCCSATGASTRRRAPGRSATASGSPRQRFEQVGRPSSPTSTRSPRSTGCSPAAPRSTSGSRGSRRARSGGRPSRGCAASAASTRSPRSCSISRSATSLASNAPAQLAAWLGLVPALHQSGESEHARLDHQDRLAATPAGCSSRPPGTTCASRGSASPCATASRPARPRPPDRLARAAPPLPPPPRLRGRGKPGNVATVAAARELACFLWAAAMTD